MKAGNVAVVYRSRINGASKVAFAPEVELSEPSQEFLTATIRTTVNLRSCADAAYQIDGGPWVPCANGTTLTLGDDMSADDAVTVQVVGYDGNGNQVAQAQATYTKRVAHGQTVAYFDSRAYPDWNDIYVYAYSNDGNNGGWPGVKPENLGNGLYRYVLPFTLESAAGLHIMWTNNGTKTEGATELPLAPRTSMIYKADRNWVAYDGSLAGIGLSHTDGTFRKSFQVTITAVDLVQADYTLGDGTKLDCLNGAVVDIDMDALAPGQSITLTASGKDADGKVYSAQAVYTRSAQAENTKVYLDTALYPDWSAPYVYLWASGVEEYAPWPGIAMTEEGNGIYSFVFPVALDGKTMNVIFSDNGANQHPDLQAQPGTQMILTAEETWTAYVQEEATEPVSPTEVSETAPAPTPTPKKPSSVGTILTVIASACVVGLTAFFLLRKRKKG